MTARLARELTCAQLVELVTDYLEDRLSREERTRFEQHVLYCTGCTAYLAQLRVQLRVTGTLTEEALSEPQRGDLLSAFRGWKKASGV